MPILESVARSLLLHGLGEEFSQGKLQFTGGRATVSAKQLAILEKDRAYGRDFGILGKLSAPARPEEIRVQRSTSHGTPGADSRPDGKAPVYIPGEEPDDLSPASTIMKPPSIKRGVSP